MFTFFPSSANGMASNKRVDKNNVRKADLHGPKVDYVLFF